MIVVVLVAHQPNRGLYIGDDVSCFDMAAQLAAKVNFHMVPEPLPKVTACTTTLTSRCTNYHVTTASAKYYRCYLHT
jgi:hypothetical protein